MHPSLRVLSSKGHTPLIHFIGKRSWPSKPEPSHPHPFAPPELKAKFADFLKKLESSTTSSGTTSKTSNKHVYEEFWDAPPRFWRPRIRELEEIEIEAVMSGGASLR